MKYYKKFQLKKYNSFKLDSLAHEIWFPESVSELTSLLKQLRGKDFDILSGATNVLLAEEIDRVICLRDCGRRKMTISTNNVYATASIPTCEFVRQINKANFKGTEGLYGMPGLLGGAIIMNAGSGKYSISDYLTTIWVTDLKGNLRKYDKKDLSFKRRYCSLQETREIIIGMSFEFKEKNINHEDISVAIKHRQQMPKHPSSGGIFINWHTLKPYTEELIGLGVADAEVSDNINIIVNKGNATFKDILMLIKKIRNIVKTPLELEVKIIGAQTL